MASKGQTIVFEIGSSSCKVGFAGRKNPVITFPTLVAGPKFHQELEVLVGNDAVNNEKIVHYSLFNPLENGLVSIHSLKGKPLIHYIIDYAYEKLSANPSEHPLLIPDCPTLESYECWQVRYDLAKIFFVDYKVPFIYFGNQSSFALLYANIDSGIVLDCGHNKTSCCMVYEGFPIYQTAVRIEHGGKDITEHIQKVVAAELDDDDFSTRKRFNFFEKIKREKCHISLNYEEEVKNYDTNKDIIISYEHKEITIGEEQIECGELLFNPSLQLVSQGISQIIYNLILNSYEQIQHDMAKSIYITGGTSQMKNFVQRVQNDLDNMGQSKFVFKVEMLPDPELASWRGASKFGMINDFTNVSVSRDEYSKNGSAIIYKKCF